MARAMRDITYPDRLKLYDHAAARNELERTVPWFVTLLTTVRSGSVFLFFLVVSLGFPVGPSRAHTSVAPPRSRVQIRDRYELAGASSIVPQDPPPPPPLVAVDSDMTASSAAQDLALAAAAVEEAAPDEDRTLE